MRSLLAEPLDIPKILEEHAASEQRVITEATPFHEAVAALRGLDRCDHCGKSRAVLNVAVKRGFHQPWKSEGINPDVHCACPGGPAYVEPPVDEKQSPFTAGVVVETIRRLFYSHRSGAMGWIAVGVRGTITTDPARRIATIQFEGHEQPYLLNLNERDLRDRVRVVA